ncbi:MAG: DUF3179 domain-containing (seleno)protein [Actinomycetota bacterium]
MPRVLVLGVVVLAGCSGAADDDKRDATAGAPVTVAQAAADPREDGPSALDDPQADGLPTPLVDTDAIISGGPPPDGIPSIDEPRFIGTSEADFLDDGEPVLALEIDGDARAYPIQVMIWHEIVNDTVGGVPVAVTYCPLCNTAVAVDRRRRFFAS